MKKKSLSVLILILAFCLSAFTLTACGKEDSTGNGDSSSDNNTPTNLIGEVVLDGVTYEIKNEVATVKDCDASATSVSISKTVAYQGYNFTVTSIGNYAFDECESLTSVTIPDSVTSIGSGAFRYCTSLTSIEIPESVTIIGEEAFAECESLTSIEIPDSVTSIGDWAFEYCPSLTSIEIPDSVTIIGEEAFAECESLTSIIVDSNNQNYKSIDGNLYSKDGKTLIQYAIGKTATGFIIPNGVTSIGNSAFSYCSSLMSIAIPNSVTSIGDRAFSGCDSLQYNEKDGLKYLGNDNNKYLYLADTVSTSITTAMIEDNCRFIGYSAFEHCPLLTSIEIPDSVTSIGKRAFSSCTSLTSIEIPDSVTSIGRDAFCGCDSLTSIEIPDSVTSIGAYAFYNCHWLQYNEKDGLKYLGNDNNKYLYLADTVSTSITTATIEDNCRFIGPFAFEDCTSLTSVVIGDSVTSIGEYAFFNCPSLTSITFNGTVEEWNAIEKGYNWGYTISATKVVCSDGEAVI